VPHHRPSDRLEGKDGTKPRCPEALNPASAAAAVKRATPNKRTVLRERLLAIASADATAATHELLVFERSATEPGRPSSNILRDSKPADEGKKTSLPRRATRSVTNVGLATFPTLDLLSRMVQDATAPPAERRKAALEAARFFLPEKPGSTSRRGKFPPDECGFSVDPNLAKELRDAKLQLASLRLSSKKLTPYAVAQKASKLQARIKEIQESLQCPCPSKYRLMYSVDGAEVPGEIVRDIERLAIFWRRREEKKTFPAEEDLEEAIRMARYDSFLVGPEIAASKRVTELRQKNRVADYGGPPLTRVEEVNLRFLGLLYPRPRRTTDYERILEGHPFWDLPAEVQQPSDLEDFEEFVRIPRFVRGNPNYPGAEFSDSPETPPSRRKRVAGNQDGDAG
jgi:hypothetical protein